ncbi:MAG TPA: hypothetical protein GYA10_12925, partial [Alphaproteobacteria bacterium]|nr:hypothetical protein [Alphaproteobacteria bacterium]
AASAEAPAEDDAAAFATPGPAEDEPPPQPVPLPPRPPARLAMPWSAISIAAVAGAILGAGLTYLLANWIALPTQGPGFADPTPALAALAERSAAIETRLGNVETTARNTQVSLDATLVQIDAGTAELRQAIEAVAARIPTAQPVDLSGIEQQLRTLENRVDAIAAGASSADASALAERVVGLEETLGALNDQIAALAARLDRGDASLASLATAVEEAKAAVAAQNRSIAGAEVGPAVRLPLIVAGLEAAFANGRPYAAELASLKTLLPDIVVPAPVASAAADGLMRPDALSDQFEAAVPAILAGRTGESTGDWTRDALEWAKALLALRPAGEIEGATPEAIVSRLEGAVKRHDYSAAAGLLAELPEPMRAAAGALGEAIAAHAAADRFVTDLRAQVLAPADAPDAGAAP